MRKNAPRVLRRRVERPVEPQRPLLPFVFLDKFVLLPPRSLLPPPLCRLLLQLPRRRRVCRRPLLPQPVLHGHIGGSLGADVTVTP